MNMEYGFETACIYGTREVQSKADKTKAITMPIYQTASFAHLGVGRSTGYDYTRTNNPTREQCEDVINALEGGFGALALSTGMSALTVLMDIFEPGDHLIASSDLYGGSVRLFDRISRKNGITVQYFDTTDTTGLEAQIRENTKAIYLETPSNPLMNVTDIRAVSQIAKAHGLLLIVDNTFLTPYFQKPISLGADIVLHSGTKYLGGHNDTQAGFLVAATRELYEKLKFIQNTTGPVLSPFDSFLIARGIKTLPLRMDRAQENAFAIVEFLKNHPKVLDVYYVGDESHPGYEISKKQTTGFGAMISFRVDSYETTLKLLEGVSLISYAESLGGVESLITFPAIQTHADVDPAVREALGITDTFVRLSVGIENSRDLIRDLEQALS